jgi:hypothetical protein
MSILLSKFIVINKTQLSRKSISASNLDDAVQVSASAAKPGPLITAH